MSSLHRNSFVLTLFSIFLICMMNVSLLLRPNLLSWLLYTEYSHSFSRHALCTCIQQSHDRHMTNLPHANSRPVSVRNIVPSTPHFTLRMTSGILEPGLHTATITGVLLERERGGGGGGEEEREMGGRV